MSNTEKTKDNPWYGVVSRVNFVDGGSFGSSLIYRGYEFNYWQIENSVVEMYRNFLRENFPDDEFLVMVNFELGGDENDVDWIDWLRDNADLIRGKLDTMIDNGAPISWKN